MVPLARLERALLAELDFESSASTNSTTGACLLREAALSDGCAPLQAYNSPIHLRFQRTSEKFVQL